MNEIKEIKRDIERVLITYGSAVLNLNKKYPVGKDTASRFNAFEVAREKGVSQICQLLEPKPNEESSIGKPIFFEANKTGTSYRRVEPKPDGSRLLTSKEIDELEKDYPYESLATHAVVDAYLKAQLTKDLKFGQARVNRIFKEIEKHIDLTEEGELIIAIGEDSHLTTRTYEWWRVLKKQEGIE